MQGGWEGLGGESHFSSAGQAKRQAGGCWWGLSVRSITARWEVCGHSDGSRLGPLPKHDLSPIALRIPAPLVPLRLCVQLAWIS